jgi:hypothetical protein
MKEHIFIFLNLMSIGSIKAMHEQTMSEEKPTFCALAATKYQLPGALEAIKEKAAHRADIRALYLVLYTCNDTYDSEKESPKYFARNVAAVNKGLYKKSLSWINKFPFHIGSPKVIEIYGLHIRNIADREDWIPENTEETIRLFKNLYTNVKNRKAN